MAEAGTATATAGTAQAAPLATVRRVTPRGEVESAMTAVLPCSDWMYGPADMLEACLVTKALSP